MIHKPRIVFLGLLSCFVVGCGRSQSPQNNSAPLPEPQQSDSGVGSPQQMGDPRAGTFESTMVINGPSGTYELRENTSITSGPSGELTLQSPRFGPLKLTVTGVGSFRIAQQSVVLSLIEGRTSQVVIWGEGGIDPQGVLSARASLVTVDGNSHAFSLVGTPKK